MFDTVSLGRRVLERRKAQGLTQEQLGAELGVSGQSVSKWENGETAPDISLLPSLCKTLGTSSDALLGITGGVGIETLSIELARRIGDMPSPARAVALVQALKYLLLLGRREPDFGGISDCHLDLEWTGGRVTGVKLWRSSGVALFAFGDILRGEAPSSEAMDRMRLLLSPPKWKIAMQLLRSPMKERQLLEAGIGPEDEVRGGLVEMVEAGLIRLDREGYKLDESSGLPWAAFIKAVCWDSGNAPLSTFFNRIP